MNQKMHFPIYGKVIAYIYQYKNLWGWQSLTTICRIITFGKKLSHLLGHILDSSNQLSAPLGKCYGPIDPFLHRFVNAQKYPT